MLLKVKEVAEQLQVSIACVYQLIEKGRLPCLRIGVGRGAIRVDEADLWGFLADCKSQKDEGATKPPRPSPRLKHLKQ